MDVKKYDFGDVFVLASIIRTLSILEEESICDVIMTGDKAEILTDLLNAGIIKDRAKVEENLDDFHLDAFANIMEALLLNEDDVEYSYIAAFHLSNHFKYKDNICSLLENFNNKEETEWNKTFIPFSEDEKRECLNYGK